MYSFLVILTLIAFVNATCPNGSTEWQSNCYCFQSNQSAFVVAEEACSNLGGHLASIHDGFTNNFIAQNAGLYFHESTTDGSNFTFSNWNHVKNATGEDCISQTISDGRWNAEDCFKPKPFVCATPSTPTNPPFIDCGHLWFYFQPTGYCYGGVYGESPLTWEEAETACENAGKDSHLASVHTVEELNYINSMVDVDWKWFWIGLYTVDKEKTWRWTDKTPVDYFAWQPTYPNLNTSACVVVDHGFIDSDCTAKYQAMCKREP